MLLLIWLIIIDRIAFGGPGGTGNPEITTSNQLDSGVDKPLSSTIDVRIGFLVGSERLRNDRTYSRPGRQLIDAFNYGIERINRLYSQKQAAANQTTAEPQDDSLKRLRFVPIVAETYGNESESIRQTIQLMTLKKVNFIVGPQETCQVEPRLASIFNVAMISHYCAQWTPPPPPSQPASSFPQVSGSVSNELTGTFIRTRPPHWKIVDRVVALVGELLSSYDCYPQQLVLLYFKTPSAGAHPAFGISGDNGHRAQLSNDALHYKLIGELLEIKLNDLFVEDGRTTPSQVNRKPLVVLNWNTTFHYGFTKNPFRRLIRRHLFHQVSSANQSQCFGGSNSIGGSFAAQPAVTKRLEPSPAAIYIVVGHYYEHLGLMLALNELNLLDSRDSSGSGGNSNSNLSEDTNDHKDHNQVRQSSVVINCARRQSVVVGVDVEQYDEHDDSVRFLRGLLMDGESGSRHSTDHNSVATLYRRYLGVVPAKPARMAEFVDEIRAALYNETGTSSSGRVQRSVTVSDQSSANRTLESIHMSARMLQFARLPVEALYLYDSLMLLGSYFHDCILLRRSTLESCADGQSAFRWFRNRFFSSYLDRQQLRFDGSAQTDGLYNLITRRHLNGSMDTSSEDAEFGLVPVGHFTDNLALEFSVAFNGIDPIWLPLRCRTLGNLTTSECKTLRDYASSSSDQSANKQSLQSLAWLTWSVLSLIGSAICFAFIVIVAKSPAICGRVSWNKKLNSEQAAGNSGWFNKVDQDNFLKIVQLYLKAPATLREESSATAAVAVATTTADAPLLREQEALQGSSALTGTSCAQVELHCHMFPFPSCKFVHWLSALYQLKEMMFQYQSFSATDVEAVQQADGGKVAAIQRRLYLPSKLLSRRRRQLGRSRRAATASTRDFFTCRHKGTGSLRLLLHKYKAINECFCSLTDLQHPSVVKLVGVTLGENKMSRLIVEQPHRGHLREALKKLDVILSAEQAVQFKQKLLPTFIADILSGLEYLHSSRIAFHGELRANTCLINADWRLQLSGFHVHHLRRSLGDYEQKYQRSSCSSRSSSSSSDGNSATAAELDYLAGLVYSAPEVLAQHQRRSVMNEQTLRLADIYSFAFLAYELLVGQEPWSCATSMISSTSNAAKLLLERVKVDSSFRPPLSRLDKQPVVASYDSDVIKRVIRSCWSHSPERRPQTVEALKGRLDSAGAKGEAGGGCCCLNSVTTAAQQSSSRNYQITSHYTELLERLSVCHQRELHSERQKSRQLELKLLPASILNKLSSNRRVPTQTFESVTFCSFAISLSSATTTTTITTTNAPEFRSESDPINQLNDVLAELDALVLTYQGQIHLLDSQADSCLRFLVYSGEPLSSEDETSLNQHQLVASFALQLVDLTRKLQRRYSCLQLRCGLHCGPVLGGLLSRCKPARYAILGPTIQFAQVLEANSLPQRIHISTELFAQLRQAQLKPATSTDLLTSFDRQGYVIIKREAKLQVKPTVEPIDSYWLINGPRLTASQSVMLSVGWSSGIGDDALSQPTTTSNKVVMLSD